MHVFRERIRSLTVHSHGVIHHDMKPPDILRQMYTWTYHVGTWNLFYHYHTKVGGSAPYLGAFGQGIFGIQGDLSMRLDSSRNTSSGSCRALFPSLDVTVAPFWGNEDELSENKGHSMPQFGLVESSSTSGNVIAIIE